MENNQPAEIHSINGKLTPNAILSMLLSRVNDIGGVGIVIEWKPGSDKDGKWSAVFSQDVTAEQAGAYLKILDMTYDATFLSEPIASDRV